MDFSRPDNARLINRLKTLSAIREKKNMTRAELSRELIINKVSISEIVDTLIKEGLVKESGKLSMESGRPATLLEINANAGNVIGMVIQKKGCLIAASDLKGKILRLERFPRGKDKEELKANLHASLERMLKSENVKIYGAVIVGTEDEGEIEDSLPFPSLIISPVEAQVTAERRRCSDELNGMLFLMAGEDIRAYYNGLLLNKFGTLRIGGKALDDLFSGSSFKRDLNLKASTAKEILSSDSGLQIIRESLHNLAEAIAAATEILNAQSTMIIGEYSDLPDQYYALLNSMVISKLPKERSSYAVFKSIAGEAGLIEGACHTALDHFFYKKELLENLRRIESL